MKESPLALENPVHKNANRLCNGDHDGKKDHDLGNAEQSHLTTSKFFWPKQGVHQINEQERRDDSRNHIFHWVLLEAFGRLGKSPQQDKKDDHNSDIENIQHDSPHLCFEQRRTITCLEHEACMINMPRTIPHWVKFADALELNPQYGRAS